MQNIAPQQESATPANRDAFLTVAPRARAIEIAANHYGIMNHPDTARAVLEHLQ